MQLVRQGLNIGSYLGNLFLEFTHTATDTGQDDRIVVKLLYLDGQERETLTDVVVKLPADPATFLLLCLNQLAAHTCKRSFGQFALGDVAKRYHSSNNLVPFPLGIRPIFNGEACSVRPPHQLVFGMNPFAGSGYPVNSALLYGEQGPVRASVMKQIVHILAEHFVNALVPQSAEARRVTERTAVFEINSINAFGSGVEKESEFLFALTHRFFRSHTYLHRDMFTDEFVPLGDYGC